MTKKKRYGLSPHTTTKKAKSFVDFDYCHKLSEAEKDWLDRFSRDYYHASFAADSHYVDKDQQREIYRTNNARQRDAYTQANPVSLEDLLEAEEAGAKKDED